MPTMHVLRTVSGRIKSFLPTEANVVYGSDHPLHTPIRIVIFPEKLSGSSRRPSG